MPNRHGQKIQKTYVPKPENHTYVAPAVADTECPVMHGFTGVTCPDCGNRYIIHCEKCEQQVSHCYCTMPKFLEEVKKREEEAKNRGNLWTPGS